MPDDIALAPGTGCRSMAASATEPGPVRVLVVDGDRRVRTSLGHLLEVADGITLTGVCTDVDAAMRVLEGGEVDVVVMDPRLPDFPAGRALAQVIADRWPGIRVVSLNWPEEHLPAAPGCVTVAPRTVQPESLLDLLRAAGGRWAA